MLCLGGQKRKRGSLLEAMGQVAAKVIWPMERTGKHIVCMSPGHKQEQQVREQVSLFPWDYICFGVGLTRCFLTFWVGLLSNHSLFFQARPTGLFELVLFPATISTSIVHVSASPWSHLQSGTFPCHHLGWLERGS